MSTYDRFLTTAEISRRTGEPAWRIRRFLDSERGPTVIRAGLYRLVPESSLPEIKAALQRSRERQLRAAQ